jgi:hypothetical protein
MVKEVKDKNDQHRIQYDAKLSFKRERKIKIFFDE